MAETWITLAQAERDADGRIAPGQLICDDAQDPGWQARLRAARHAWARGEAERVMRARLATGAPLATAATGWRSLPRTPVGRARERRARSSSASRAGPDDDSDPAGGARWPSCASSRAVRP
jgi:hypothetical protein